MSLFDENNPEFDLICKSLVTRMKELTSEGIGIEKRSAEALTMPMER